MTEEKLVRIITSELRRQSDEPERIAFVVAVDEMNENVLTLDGDFDIDALARAILKEIR